MGMAFLSSRQSRLWFMLILLLAFFVAEVVGGLLAHSLALLADAFHMLSDMLAILIAIYAIRVAKTHPSETMTINTYGWQRAEVLGAFANGVFLLALCLAIFLQAIERFISPEEITNPFMVLVVGSAGLAVNLIGIWLFHDYHGGGGGDSHHHHHHHVADTSSLSVSSSQEDRKHLVKHMSIRHSLSPSPVTEIPSELDVKETSVCHRKTNRRCLPSCQDNCAMPEHYSFEPIIEEEEILEIKLAHHNMQGVFLHVLGDALGSVGVILSALIIWLTTFKARFYFDPIISVLIVFFICWSTIPLVKSTGFILLQAVPEAINLETIHKDLMKTPGVLNIHELHVWQLSDTKLIASAHVACDETQDYMEIASNIKKTFHRFGIHSSTIQPEFVYSGTVRNTTDCLLQCLNDSCQQKICCVRLPTPDSLNEPELIEATTSPVLPSSEQHELESIRSDS